ncbi:alpha,alpha-trehalose-phosphate synthase (UDP-forming) [Pseudactinotalea sp. Z1739]|uniref:alpha,alpha-trehalose-phosphate synthase (UDP-forming) n=1 Tax=Pseudactinotalea sp. Z1739 TaxID=3413028 RepID=UPI003C7EABD8
MAKNRSAGSTGRGHDFVVVANRLPVDATVDQDGTVQWTRSPGGLVTALAPLMRSGDGAWVGWPGRTEEDLDPFEADGIHLRPVPLTQQEVTDYYEGFSNATLWPLYHDVIVPPEYHRHWWNTYRKVNERFATEAADAADEGAEVWVQDYQLQLVPAMLRRMRPDLRIGFFNHIPFPPVELFGQLPWRSAVIEGLLGADLVGFQRSGDAANFLRAVRRFTTHSTRGNEIAIDPGTQADDADDAHNTGRRQVRAAAFPISIDAAHFDEVARSEPVLERAAQIRRELGDPRTVLLGVDRLDYTKGIRHRFKAFGELLDEGKITAPGTALVQVASPSRERVEQYQALRHQIEESVGHINGQHGSLAGAAIYYMHHSYPMEEMAALYLAADVMLVTSLRDGMNLVAKEYAAARHDLGGVLVLSEFAGAAADLPQALLINPHDIEGTKAAIMRAIDMPERDRRRRMRALRRRVMDNDVRQWAQAFLSTLQALTQER